MDSRKALGTLVLAFAVTSVVPATAFAAKDDLLLVSRVGVFGPGAVGTHSTAPSTSADGRYVAFESGADNLSEEDNNAVQNVFVRDTVLGTVTLVSRVSGASGAGGDDSSHDPSISANGRFVAFQSVADNLSTADDDTVADIFVRDMVQGSTTYVSRATGAAGTPGEVSSSGPSISADGRFVAFESPAESLSGDDGPVRDIFVRDTLQNTTTYVSRATSGTASNADSFDASISGNGRHVAFDSVANNLDDDPDSASDVFVRDTALDTTTYVSRATSGAAGDGDSSFPAISADGRYVTFESSSDNLALDDDKAFNDVFVRDTVGNTTVHVSRATNGAAATGGNSSDPTISADGRYVAFGSGADDLSDEDNAGSDVFLRDTVLNTTVFVSRAAGAAGAAGDDSADVPVISADGRAVAFQSNANNLSGADDDAFVNVFVRDVLGAPPVNSGLPQVSGSAVVGGVLSCSNGTWDNNPASFARQWKRGGVDIAGATGMTYTVVSGDVGQAITCTVVATNTGGSGSATSNAVFPPAAGADGADGSTGATGPTGPAGPVGPTGPAGADGQRITVLFVAITLPRLKARQGGRLVVSYVSTATANATLDVLRSGRRVGRVTGSARAGRNTLVYRVPRKLATGKYKLRLRGSAGGQTSTDTAPLRIIRR